MAYVKPTASDFKAYFTRDFPYGSTNNTILDNDITKAIDEASLNFNESLFPDQAEYTIGFLYLTAHYLVMDIRASGQGITGNYPWLSNSKSVGSVSEGVTIPDFIANNPLLAHYGKTYYGAKYISIVFPRMIGNMFSTPGGTKP